MALLMPERFTTLPTARHSHRQLFAKAAIASSRLPRSRA